MKLTRTLLLGISIVLITSACSNSSGEDQKSPVIPETTKPDVEKKELIQDEQTEQLPTSPSEPPIDIETVVQPPIVAPDPIIIPDPIITIHEPGMIVIQPTPDPIYTQLQKGIFLDSEVAGLTYSTNSTSGITDTDGSFEFYLNDTIEFSLGDTTLGSINTEELFFYDPSSSYPFSLGTSMPDEQFNTALITPLILTSEAEYEDDHRVINKLIFLQTLDINGYPDDGIDIPEIISSQINGWNIDFNLSVDEFSTGSFFSLVSYLNELEVYTDNYPRQLTDKIDALLHFKKIRPTLPNIGQFYQYGPDRYHIYWRFDDECPTPLHSIIELVENAYQLKPISNDSRSFTGVRISNGKLLFPSFEMNTSCSKVCAQPTIESNFTLKSNELSGTLKAYCPEEQPPIEYLINPYSINKQVYTYDWGFISGSTNTVH